MWPEISSTAWYGLGTRSKSPSARIARCISLEDAHRFLVLAGLSRHVGSRQQKPEDNDSCQNQNAIWRRPQIQIRRTKRKGRHWVLAEIIGGGAYVPPVTNSGTIVALDRVST